MMIYKTLKMINLYLRCLIKNQTFKFHKCHHVYKNCNFIYKYILVLIDKVKKFINQAHDDVLNENLAGTCDIEISNNNLFELPDLKENLNNTEIVDISKTPLKLTKSTGDV